MRPRRRISSTNNLREAISRQGKGTLSRRKENLKQGAGQAKKGSRFAALTHAREHDARFPESYQHKTQPYAAAGGARVKYEKKVERPLFEMLFSQGKHGGEGSQGG